MPSLGPGGRGGARRRTRRRMSRRNSMEEQARETGQAQAGEQQGAAPAGSQGNEPAYLGELEKLGELREKGIITDEEFEAKKKQLLGL